MTLQIKGPKFKLIFKTANILGQFLTLPGLVVLFPARHVFSGGQHIHFKRGVYQIENPQYHHETNDTLFDECHVQDGDEDIHQQPEYSDPYSGTYKFPEIFG